MILVMLRGRVGGRQERTCRKSSGWWFFFISPGRSNSSGSSRTQTPLEKNEMLLNFPIRVGTQGTSCVTQGV